MKNNKNTDPAIKPRAGLIIAGLVAFICLVFNISGCVSPEIPISLLLINNCKAILCLVILLYVAALYRIPHGNYMKYLFLLFAVRISVETVVNRADRAELIMSLVMIMAACYMAGRLHKLKQNIIVLAVVFIASVVRAALLLPVFSEAGLRGLQLAFAAFDTSLVWLALALAYLVRYREHKEAGLLDKADAK